MVAALEGDGVLRPLEVGGRSRANRTNLPELALPLACGEPSRTSSKDQETVLDFGETVPIVVVILVIRRLLHIFLVRSARVESA